MVYLALITLNMEIRKIKIGEKEFEAVNTFKYLGSLIDNEHRTDKCIQEQIQKGNRAYHANKQVLRSKLISRNTKLRVYKVIIRPVATYGSETWTMTVKDENALRSFERKIMRRIYGPVNEDGGLDGITK